MIKIQLFKFMCLLDLWSCAKPANLWNWSQWLCRRCLWNWSEPRHWVLAELWVGTQFSILQVYNNWHYILLFLKNMEKAWLKCIEKSSCFKNWSALQLVVDLHFIFTERKICQFYDCSQCQWPREPVIHYIKESFYCTPPFFSTILKIYG